MYVHVYIMCTCTTYVHVYTLYVHVYTMYVHVPLMYIVCTCIYNVCTWFHGSQVRVAAAGCLHAAVALELATGQMWAAGRLGSRAPCGGLASCLARGPTRRAYQLLSASHADSDAASRLKELGPRARAWFPDVPDQGRAAQPLAAFSTGGRWLPAGWTSTVARA